LHCIDAVLASSISSLSIYILMYLFISWHLVLLLLHCFSTLRTVTSTVLQALLLDSFVSEKYRQWALVRMPHYQRIAKLDALPFHDCIEIHTKLNFITVLNTNETAFNAAT
jgi:hypothetical protein